MEVVQPARPSQGLEAVSEELERVQALLPSDKDEPGLVGPNPGDPEFPPAIYSPDTNFAVVNGKEFTFDGYAGQEMRLAEGRGAVVAIKFNVSDPSEALTITLELQKLTKAKWAERTGEKDDSGA